MMLSPRSPSVLCLIAGLLAAGCGRPVPAAPPAPAGAAVRVPHPSDSTLFARAAAIVRAGPRVAELWPPYWGTDRAFMLTRKADQAMLLVSPTPPGDGFAPLSGGDVPPVLRGRAFIRYGFPEELAMSGGFTTAFPVGDTTVPSLPLDFSHDHFYFLAGHFHEAFHAYQSRRFNEAAGVKSGFGEPIATSPRAGTAEFAARAEIERRILAAALRTPSLDSLRPLLLGYLAVRHARSWGAPDVQQVERAMELDEGTAGLVGYEAALLATDQPRARIPEVVVERELGKPLAGMPEFPESDARLMRWRMYGTGAALGLLLERLGRRDWRARAEAGSYLDVMLAHAVGFRHVEHVPLDEQARRRFGYDAVLSGAEAGRGRGGGPPPPPVP